MYTRSPAAYEALKSFKLLQLPCVRTLKHYIDANLSWRSGTSTTGEKEAVRFHDYALKTTGRGKKRAKKGTTGVDTSSKDKFKSLLPLGEGVLIIDEVKVHVCKCLIL